LDGWSYSHLGALPVRDGCGSGPNDQSSIQRVIGLLQEIGLYMGCWTRLGLIWGLLPHAYHLLPAGGPSLSCVLVLKSSVYVCERERELIDWFNAISSTGLECPTYNEITSRTEKGNITWNLFYFRIL
jgi:hypothetical protein